MFGQAWSKKELQHLCPNLLQMIGLFNRLSRWVGSEIVQQRKLATRAKAFQKFISIASVRSLSLSLSLSLLPSLLLPTSALPSLVPLPRPDQRSTCGS